MEKQYCELVKEWSGEYVIKSVRPAHGGLEYVIQLQSDRFDILNETHKTKKADKSERFAITAADFRRIGEDVLFQGNLIDGDVFEELCFAGEKLSCIQKALNHLEYGPLSERKLKIKLHGKFSKEAIEASLEILKENGYIDDMVLAKDYCEEYFVNCNMSPAKIKAKLFQKGFDRETVSTVFDEYDFSEEIIFENMEALVRQKFGKNFFEDFEENKEMRRKALEYLIRQGYSYDDALGFIRVER